MSKEQKPITAEEFRNDYAKKLQYLNWDDLCEDLWSKGDAMTKTENEVMEQYAQYREKIAVLEALESREHIDCGKDGVKTICPVCRNVLWTTKQK